MRNHIQSWFFFTALLLFLIAAAISLPVLGTRLLGSTQGRIEAVAEDAETRAQAVWSELHP